MFLGTNGSFVTTKVNLSKVEIYLYWIMYKRIIYNENLLSRQNDLFWCLRFPAKRLFKAISGDGRKKSRSHQLVGIQTKEY